MSKSKHNLLAIISISVTAIIIAVMIPVLVCIIKPYSYNKKAEKLKEVLNGKTMSILGDSISTFDGVSNDYINSNSTIKDNAICYYEGGPVRSADYTWWKRAADKANLQILVNNSFSGDFLHGSGKGMERAKQLHCDVGERKGTTPDIIVIYFGINDYIQQYPRNFFGEDYCRLLETVKETYPNAKVFCCNLPTIGNNENAVSLKSYNNVIKKAVNKNGCYLVDLFGSSGITPKNLSSCMMDEWLHPNEKGMELISECLLKTFMAAYL